MAHGSGSLVRGFFIAFWAVVSALFLILGFGVSPGFADSIKYEYDELGRLIIVSDTDENLTDYNFDPAGNRTDSDVVLGAGAGPKFTLSDAFAEEGGTMTFVVTLHNGAGATYTVDYATEDDGAVSPGDYTSTSGTLTFTSATGTVSQNVTVTTIDDTTNELDNERLIFRLSNATGDASIFDDEGHGYILTGDSRNRPPIGQTIDLGTFLSNTLPQTVQVTNIGCDPDGDDIAIIPGSLTQPVDQNGNSGQSSTTLNPDGKSISLFINGTKFDWSFQFEIQDPFGQTSIATRTFSIEFDDTGGCGGPGEPICQIAPSGDVFFEFSFPPAMMMFYFAGCSSAFNQASPDTTSFSIDDVSAVEGLNLVFTVTKTGSSSETTSLQYSTSDGTATEADYTPLSGGLTFTPEQTSKTVSIATAFDGEAELDETMTVDLVKVSGPGTISDAQGVGTIQNGGAPPDTASFSIDDVQVTEGGDLVFTVTKAGTATQSYSVDFATADGTATLADSDYTSNSGTLTFLDTETTKTITVNTTADGTAETDETVLVNLSNPTGSSTITDGQGTGTILNDDGTPDNASFSIDDVNVTEGGNLVFTVTKSGQATQTYTVDFATADGTATLADSDYTSNSGTLTFLDTETTKTITVNTTADGTVEADETVFVNLSNPSGTSTIFDSQGTGTINNDDETPPSFSINDVSVTEGGNLVFTVTKTGSVSQTYAVNFATADGTATLANNDYTANSGTLTFTNVDTTKTVTVNTTADSTVENDETVFVNLSNATNGATISDSQGIGTITNDDNPPVSFSVADRTRTEGQNFNFQIIKNGTATQSHSVSYFTQDGSATAPADYTAQSGTVTFGINETSKTINIPSIDDTKIEAQEDFLFKINNPTGGATISDGTAVGFINDNDEPGGGGGGLPLSVDPLTGESITDPATEETPEEEGGGS